MREVKADLERFCSFAAIHRGKEIENFLLQPKAMLRVICAELEKKGVAPLAEKEFESFLMELTDGMKNRVQAQYVKHYVDFERRRTPGVDLATFTERAMNDFDLAWGSMETRLQIAPGKELISAINEVLQSRFGVHLSHMRVADAMRTSEIPLELKALLEELDRFRKTEPPGA